ncbi:hypothetical protein BDQ94DRAFT_75684 [Aspergillus welwitschiae]|uniref:Uncharacterized protein n=1 Tax=Aspergillus welwitschiae TaxID=1341132 RepID=A0A3F3PTT9_9EURO|nr:hypothetical protein BDQ94DRAFT_75684 [Aspergillus welwitschiae]RDH30370.1 hypothetical protein BDQ94DRAFT_75684 [Aspergillus welwitschiae]
MLHKTDFSGNLASLSMPWRSPKANVLEDHYDPLARGSLRPSKIACGVGSIIPSPSRRLISLPPALGFRSMPKSVNKDQHPGDINPSNARLFKPKSPMTAPTPKDPKVALYRHTSNCQGFCKEKSCNTFRTPGHAEFQILYCEHAVNRPQFQLSKQGKLRCCT